MSAQASSADYVVIGGGSAGCIVAARLAAAGHRVTLLEAGDAAEANPETLSSDGFKYAFANDATMHHRMSDAAGQSDARARRVGKKYVGTGRGMGGSGGVNGMVYTRGDKRDFAHWPAGWQWDDLAPAFAAVEEKLRPRPRPMTPFIERFVAACVGQGMRHEEGMNTGDLAGVVGANAMNYEGADRRHSYRAFIQEASLPNLTVITGAQVERIAFAGDRAIAVYYKKNSRSGSVRVAKEVILCAGALETPRLLLLSGIGPAAHLQSVGVPVVHNSAGVGLHLQDHPNVCLFYRGQVPLDFAYPQVYAFDAAQRLAQQEAAAPDTCWVCYSAPASIQQAMQRMLPVLALPGKLHDVALLRKALRALIDAAFVLPPVKRFVANIFGIVVILGKPSARGSVRLRSHDPAAPALIDPAFYATPHDQRLIEAGIGKARQMAAHPALAAVGVKPLSAGGKNISGDKLWRWISKATMTTYHFCGSVRMGHDALSPVDPDSLRVKGLANVRVADASVMPEIPVSALNAPSMMIGYRAAEFILTENKA